MRTNIENEYALSLIFITFKHQRDIGCFYFFRNNLLKKVYIFKAILINILYHSLDMKENHFFQSTCKLIYLDQVNELNLCKKGYRILFIYHHLCGQFFQISMFFLFVVRYF